MVPLRGVAQKTPLASDIITAQEVFQYFKVKMVEARLKDDITQVEWCTQFMQVPDFRMGVARDWSIPSNAEHNSVVSHSLNAWLRVAAYRKMRRATLKMAPFMHMPDRITPLTPERYEEFFTDVLRARFKTMVGTPKGDLDEFRVFLWRSQRLWGTPSERHYTIRVEKTAFKFFNLRGGEEHVVNRVSVPR